MNEELVSLSMCGEGTIPATPSEDTTPRPYSPAHLDDEAILSIGTAEGANRHAPVPFGGGANGIPPPFSTSYHPILPQVTFTLRILKGFLSAIYRFP